MVSFTKLALLRIFQLIYNERREKEREHGSRQAFRVWFF